MANLEAQPSQQPPFEAKPEKNDAVIDTAKEGITQLRALLESSGQKLQEKAIEDIERKTQLMDLYLQGLEKALNLWVATHEQFAKPRVAIQTAQNTLRVIADPNLTKEEKIKQIISFQFSDQLQRPEIPTEEIQELSKIYKDAFLLLFGLN